jgi:hypothetical protein
MKTDGGKRIVLHEVRGLGTDQFTLLDGVDEDGKIWVYHRQRLQYNCAICGAPVTDCWLRFDNGDAVCTPHVTIIGEIQQSEKPV